MTSLFTTIALLAASALPPHPLGQTIGGRDGNQKPRRVEVVRQQILDSRAFESMVKASVAMAQSPRLAEDIELKDLNFGQRTRIVLARLFADINYVDEFQPSMERGFGRRNGPLPPHPLDRVIGVQARSDAEVVQALRSSRIFAELINGAADESEPLPRGQAGASYADAVRIAISRALEQPVPVQATQVTEDAHPAGDVKPSDEVAREIAKLQGTWDFAFLQNDGKPRDIAGRQYVFAGNQLIIRQGDQILDKVAYQLDPTTNPKSIHIDFDVRVGDKRVGAKGIYSLDGNTLTFCTVAAVLPLPTAFASPEGSHAWLVVMKRAKESVNDRAAATEQPSAPLFDRKYIAVANQTPHELKVYLKYYTKTTDGKWQWFPNEPGKGEPTSFTFKPGEMSYLFVGDWKVNASRIRIWAQSAQQGVWVDFRDKDLMLVPAGGYRGKLANTFDTAVIPFTAER